MDNGLVGYLAAVAGMRPPLDGMEHSSMEDFVLRHGFEFKTGEFTHEGEKKMCFMNAYHLAEENDDLVYCEGFGFSIIPTLHAWCVRFDGTVVDPTWDSASGYVGVPFKLSCVRRTLLKRKYYGMLDDWQGRWPLLRKFDESVVDRRVRGSVVGDYSGVFNQAKELTKGMVIA